MSPTSRPGQPSLRHLADKPLQERDQVGMAPVAVARQPHHLPGLAVDRQRLAAGEAALGVEADRARRHAARRAACGRTIPWRHRSGSSGIGERRQRLRIERAVVLRHGAGRQSQGSGHKRRRTSQTFDLRCRAAPAGGPSGRTGRIIACLLTFSASSSPPGTSYRPAKPHTRNLYNGFGARDAVHRVVKSLLGRGISSCTRLRSQLRGSPWAFSR